MKRRILALSLLLIMCLAFANTAMAVTVTPYSASGQCSISASGKTITYSGLSISNKAEDFISVDVRLMELRNGIWTQIDSRYASATNSTYATATGSKTVSGGCYYQVTATHYSRTGSTGYSCESSTTTLWVA